MAAEAKPPEDRLGLGMTGEYIREDLVKWGVSPTQCTKYVHNGETYFMYIDRSRDLPPDDTLYTNILGRAIKEEPYGIYTWIWFLNKSGQERFQSVRVESPSELGTKHISLLLRSLADIKILIYAGELLKYCPLEGGPDTYMINFYSGSTGMKDLGGHKPIEDGFIDRLHEHLNLQKKVNIRVSEVSFNIADIPTDPEVLANLEREGYHLLFFTDKAQCMDYKTYLIRHLAEKLELCALRSKHKEADECYGEIWDEIVATHARAELPMPYANSLAELEYKTKA